MDTAPGWVYPSPVLTRAPAGEWSLEATSCRLVTSHSKQRHGFGRRTGYRKILQFNSKGSSRSCHVGLGGNGTARGREEAQLVPLSHHKHTHTRAICQALASPSQAQKTHRTGTLPSKRLLHFRIPKASQVPKSQVPLTFLVGCKGPSRFGVARWLLSPRTLCSTFARG